MSYNLETNMYEGYIYKITNKVNGKIYIGQTRRNVATRWQSHLSEAKTEKHLGYFHAALNKYGEINFDIEILESVSCTTIDELKNVLNDLEIKYIAIYDSCNNQKGYNLTRGGQNAIEYQKCKTYCYTAWGEFVKEFDSRAEAGNYIGVDGWTISQTIFRNGICRRHYFSNKKEFNYKPKSKDIPVNVYSLDGSFVGSYISYSVAAKELNVSISGALSVCKKRIKSCGGYVFRFYNDEFNGYKRDSYRPINIYKNNKYIKTFNTTKDGANFIGCFPTNLTAVLKGKQKTAKGYTAYYVDNPNQPDKSKIVA